MDGSVRLLVRREKLTQDLNEYLASDLTRCIGAGCGWGAGG